MATPSQMDSLFYAMETMVRYYGNKCNDTEKGDPLHGICVIYEKQMKQALLDCSKKWCG